MPHFFMVHFITPFREDKNLGKAYNDAIALLPEEDHVCLMDIDAMFLLPEQPLEICKAVEEYHECVLTCLTGRISEHSPQKTTDQGDSILANIRHARGVLDENKPPVTTIRPISGFLMCFPVRLWKLFPFKEGIGCLGVDTEWSKRLLDNNVRIIVLQHLFVYHMYRLEHGIHYKKHLR